MNVPFLFFQHTYGRKKETSNTTQTMLWKVQHKATCERNSRPQLSLFFFLSVEKKKLLAGLQDWSHYPSKGQHFFFFLQCSLRECKERTQSESFFFFYYCRCLVDKVYKEYIINSLQKGYYIPIILPRTFQGLQYSLDTGNAVICLLLWQNIFLICYK